MLIQWDGDGPESESRNLRAAPLSTRFQQFYKRRVETLPSAAKTHAEEKKLRTLGESEETYNHKVTFEDCVFRVSFVDSSISQGI